MTTPSRFESLNAETADAAVRPILAASAKNFGFLPQPIAKAAHSPALLRHLLAGFNAFDASTLTELEREVVAMTVAFEVGCHYCMALHSALLSRRPEQAQLLAALREGTVLADPRLEALKRYARALVRERGRLSAAEWQAARDAGFNQRQLLDAVLGVGVYLLSTLTNLATEANLDSALEPFHWQAPVVQR